MTSNQEKIRELQKQIDILKGNNDVYELIIAYMDKKGFDINIRPLFHIDDEGYHFYCFSYDKKTNSIVGAEVDRNFYNKIAYEHPVEWGDVVDYWKETKKEK